MTTKTRRRAPKLSQKQVALSTPDVNGATPAPPREVCLLGYAEESRDLVNSLPEHVEVWGINMAFVFMKRKAHAWFQLHPRDWSSGGGAPTGYWGRPKEHLDFMAKFEGPVWMQYPDEAPEVPNRRLYPLDAIVSAVGRDYMTSTFAYQMAFLLWEHLTGKPVERLYVYGINLTSMDEYAYQKPAAEYWLGRLEQAGVKLHVPAASGLLQGPRYARDPGGLTAHAQKALEHWRGKYYENWSNAIASTAVQRNTQFWARKISEVLNAAWPDAPEETRKRTLGMFQQAFAERERQEKGLLDKSVADLNGAMGMVKSTSHWLGLLGGPDFRALGLPEARFASSALSTDFVMPTEMRRI